MGEFKAVVGDVPLCKKMLQADGDTSAPAPAAKAKGGGDGGKKAPKQQKKKKGGDAAPAPAPKKKVKHPLAVLNKKKPAAVHIDEWKKTYKNCPHDGTGYAGACDKFWELLGEGVKTGDYSVWQCKYKHNAEHELLWMTSNAISGFVERTEEIRKYTMGVQAVSGDKDGAGNIYVSGVWLFRGDTVDHMLNCNPDAEHYEWIKLTDSAGDKAILKEHWAGGENDGDFVAGKAYYDSKVFV